MNIVYGADTAAISHEGSSVLVTKGDVWDADDPFVKAHANLFTDTPDPENVKRTVARDRIEQATQNPGETRTTKRG